jgi:E3 ubiquitin-protein ligase UBR4
LAHLRRSFKSGSFEVRPRPEHAAPQELQPAILMGTLRRAALSCSRGTGLLAVAEGDKVCVLDAGALVRLDKCVLFCYNHFLYKLNSVAP